MTEFIYRSVVSGRYLGDQRLKFCDNPLISVDHKPVQVNLLNLLVGWSKSLARIVAAFLWRG
jgi:hypothetical protein